MAREEMIARSLEALGELASIYGESWNPRVARAYDFPSPLPGEAVSSWLIRYAIRKNCSPGKVLDWIGVSWQKPIFWLDFDREALPWDYLGKLISTPATTLKELVPDNGDLLLGPALLCLHTDPMRMLPHLRYCPQCLASDIIPYYRSSWRLASNWICQKHGCVMRDYCPVCQQPLFWNYSTRNRTRILDLRMCHHCGGDLCPPQQADDSLPFWLKAELHAIQREFTYNLGCHGDHEALLTPHSESPSPPDRPVMNTETAFEKLAQVIRILDFSAKPDFPGPYVGVGIEAKALFGRATGQICSSLMEQQNLFGTTLWWSGENILKNALRQTWSRQDFDRTKQWVIRYCNHSTQMQHCCSLS